MNLGAEPKKVAFLAAVVVFGGGYAIYSNMSSSPSSSAPSRAARPTPGPAAPSYAEPEAVLHRTASSSRTSEEFRPTLRPKRPEDRVDPMMIDPTLRLDLLAKVQAVQMEGGSRNLFQVGQAPPAQLPPEPSIKLAKNREVGPQLPPAPPPPPPAPQAPPITLKYYGYSSARGDNRKHAFFLDGEDILVGAEGDVVKKRYRVVRIGVNSVVMEDTQFKHEQTLPLTEEGAAG